jgi:hypothetical protein
MRSRGRNKHLADPQHWQALSMGILSDKTAAEVKINYQQALWIRMIFLAG